MNTNEYIDYLIELGVNMVPINLGSFLNTFPDAKNDIENDTNSREYGTIINKGNDNRAKDIYGNVLYAYNNPAIVCNVVFIDIDDTDYKHSCLCSDNILIVKVFVSDNVNRKTELLFINEYYASNYYHGEYDIVINKEYKE